MKCEVPIRIRVLRPPAGVATLVQSGRSDLESPTRATGDSLTFDLVMTVDMASGVPNFLGKFAQGPRDARFVYVNSGQYAGQAHTCVARRAKLTLMPITRQQIEKVTDGEDLVLETEYEGTGRDGGPTCASVQGLEWKVAKR